MFGLRAGVAAAVVLSLSVGTVQAQDAEPTLWPETARKVGRSDYILTGLALSSMAFTLLPERDTTWQATSRLDDLTRKRLRGAAASTRDRAARVSDAFLYSAAAYPFLIDSLLLAGARHRSWDTFGQMALMSSEAMLLTASITTLVKTLSHRTRPYALGCDGPQGADDPRCASESRSAHHSFFSGHSSLVATAAGLSCVAHARLELYESRAAGRATCGVLSAVAVTTGALRVVADRHHLTDVLTGLTVGFAVGIAVPALHLPRRGRRTNLSLQAGAGGVSLSGSF